MLDIMAFSSYPNPVTPAVPFTTSSMQATFSQLRTTLGLMNQVASRYGRFNSGPYTDQYIKQGLAIEYASAFSYPSEVEYQQQHTQLYFDTLQAYPWFLGALWFEPTYTYNNWEGGKGSLYHKWNSSNAEQTPEAPYAMLTTWASFAQSPVPSGWPIVPILLQLLIDTTGHKLSNGLYALHVDMADLSWSFDFQRPHHILACCTVIPLLWRLCCKATKQNEVPSCVLFGA